MSTEPATGDMASRLYPDMASTTPAAPAPGNQPESAGQALDTTPARADTPPSAAPASGSDLAAESAPAAPSTAEIDAAIEALVDKPLSMEERLYPGAPGHGTVEEAHAALATRFEPHMADAPPEERDALVEGRQAAAQLLHDWQVPRDVANELAGAFDEANYRWVAGELPDDATFEQQRQDGIRTLRQEWGREFDARCALATRAYREALKTAPWLENLVEAVGAGNNAKVVKHFANIGLRNARRGRAKR